MSRLRIYPDTAPETTLLDSRDGAVISAELARIGVTFERWQANQSIEPGAPQETVIAAYKDDIDRLVAARGFSNVDVVSIAPDNPKRAELRAKFLDEHFHIEDEVRFFVAGSGLFTLHVGGNIQQIECVQGDLIGVPDRALHWFDMGAEPHFVAIRFFTDPAGWVGHFTGSDLARKFPYYTPPEQPATAA